MPAQFIQEELAEIESLDLENDAVIIKLAEKYNVSRQAMTFRLSWLCSTIKKNI